MEVDEVDDLELQARGKKPDRLDILPNLDAAPTRPEKGFEPPKSRVVSNSRGELGELLHSRLRDASSANHIRTGMTNLRGRGKCGRGFEIEVIPRDHSKPSSESLLPGWLIVQVESEGGNQPGEPGIPSPNLVLPLQAREGEKKA
jgi:hypothetical protein